MSNAVFQPSIQLIVNYHSRRLRMWSAPRNNRWQKHFLTAEAILADARLNLYIISHRIGPSCVSVQNKILVIRTYWAYFCSKVFLMGLLWRAYYIPEGILSEGFLRHRLWGVAYFREDVFFGEVKRRPIEILGHSLFFFAACCVPLILTKEK